MRSKIGDVVAVTRFRDLDVARGAGMLLVVIGTCRNFLKQSSGYTFSICLSSLS